MTETEKMLDLIQHAKEGRSDFHLIQDILFYVKEQAGVKEDYVMSPRHIYELCEKEAKVEKEHCIVLFLNTKNKVVKRIVSIGTVSTSIVHPREIFREAIRQNASSIIFVHNHPSGSLYPSDEDEKTTSRLKEAGKIIGITLLDSIIISKEGYYSFQGEGKL